MKAPDKKQHGHLATMAITIGAIATILQKVTDIGDLLVTKWGIKGLAGFEIILFLSILILLGGYVLGFSWIYRVLAGGFRGTGKAVLAIGILIGLVGTAYATLHFVPFGANLEKILEGQIPQWSELIIQNQSLAGNKRGGFRILMNDPNARTQVWTTAQSLTALLADVSNAKKYKGAIKSAITYIDAVYESRDVDLQLEDGWGYFSERTLAVTEVGAWVVVARIAAIERGIWGETEVGRQIALTERDLKWIFERQDITSGGWGPISIVQTSYTRTYSSVMALWALVEAKRSSQVAAKIGNRYDHSIRSGINWLMATTTERGWFPNPNRKPPQESFPGLTAQLLFVLSRAETLNEIDSFKVNPLYTKMKKAFLQQSNVNQRMICANERVPDADQHFPGSDFQLEGSTFLWFPWSLLTFTNLSLDGSLSDEERTLAITLRKDLITKLPDILMHVGRGGTYEVAENLFGVANSLRH